MGSKSGNIFLSYLVLILALALGIGILGVSGKIHLPGVNNAIVVCSLFVILNIAFVFLLRLNKELREYWAVRKLKYLPLAFAAGSIIALLPAGLSLIAGKAEQGDISLAFSFSLSGLCLTFIIVTWEELWFRGIFLNYCRRHISVINLSITMGLLFMLIHIINPEIDLLKKGPALFFAGALLTILYFYFKSLWIPIGLHFGNNYIGSVLKSKYDADVFWGGDGYLTALVLGLCFAYFFIKSRNHDQLGVS